MAQPHRTYVHRPFPWHTLEDALQIPEAIQKENKGRPMKRVLLANAIGRKPSSSEFRVLLRSSAQYGLTTGSEKATDISLTPRGEAIVKPRNAAEKATALRSAAVQPDLLRRIYDHYDNKKLPTEGDFFTNVLERDFQVPRERATDCTQILVQNGRFVNIVRELDGDLYVLLTPEAGETLAPEAPVEEAPVEEAAPPIPPAPPPPGERHIFIAHGKNRTPLEQLKKVLDQFKIQYKVAIDEPQKARPISVKVADIMRSCQSAIFIFSADEEFTNAEGQTVWRPSQNVIYELGAASVLYGNKIVIFKEQGLDFPTDFRDIGNIAFEKDTLDARGVQLIAELIALGLVSVQPT